MANEKKEKAAKGGKWLVSKVNLKGDFDVDDGLGVNQIDLPAGHKFRTEDADLQAQLIDQGYAKTFSKAEDDDASEVAASGDGTNGPAVKA